MTSPRDEATQRPIAAGARSDGPRQDLRLGVSYALLTSLVGSVAAAGAKFLGDRVSPYTIVFAQYLVGVLVLVPWLARNGLRAVATERPWLHFWRSIAGWIGFMAYYAAIVHIPLVEAALLRSAAPLWVPLILLTWLGVRLPAIRWAAIATGFAGVLLILHPQPGQYSVWHFVGLFAGIGLAVSMATTRRLAATEAPQAIIFWYFGIAGLATLPFALLNFRLPSLADSLVLVLVGFSIYVTMALYTAAYSHAKSSVISPLSFVGVVFAGAFGFLLWDEVPGWLSLSGTVLVVAGGLWAIWLESRGTTDEE